MKNNEYKGMLEKVKCSEEFKKEMTEKLSSPAIEMTDFSESVSGIEHAPRFNFGRIAAIAASVVLIGGAAAGTVYYAKNIKTKPAVIEDQKLSPMYRLTEGKEELTAAYGIIEPGQADINKTTQIPRDKRDRVLEKLDSLEWTADDEAVPSDDLYRIKLHFWTKNNDERSFVSHTLTIDTDGNALFFSVYDHPDAPAYDHVEVKYDKEYFKFSADDYEELFDILTGAEETTTTAAVVDVTMVSKASTTTTTTTTTTLTTVQPETNAVTTTAEETTAAEITASDQEIADFINNAFTLTAEDHTVVCRPDDGQYIPVFCYRLDNYESVKSAMITYAWEASDKWEKVPNEDFPWNEYYVAGTLVISADGYLTDQKTTYYIPDAEQRGNILSMFRDPFLNTLSCNVMYRIMKGADNYKSMKADYSGSYLIPAENSKTGEKYSMDFSGTISRDVNNNTLDASVNCTNRHQADDKRTATIHIDDSNVYNGNGLKFTEKKTNGEVTIEYDTSAPSEGIDSILLDYTRVDEEAIGFLQKYSQTPENECSEMVIPKDDGTFSYRFTITSSDGTEESIAVDMTAGGQIIYYEHRPTQYDSYYTVYILDNYEFNY